MGIRYAETVKRRKRGGGRKPSDDPTVVRSIRIPKSIDAALKPGWRKRVAEFLASEVVK
jgi:hypothetical protein